MREPFTEEQLQRLMTAIDNAREVGACAYVINGQPGCVVGQLAALEGISVDAMRFWERAGIGGGEIDQWPEALALKKKYGSRILAELQSIWDSTNAFEDEAREEMRAYVTKHPVPLDYSADAVAAVDDSTKQS